MNGSKPCSPAGRPSAKGCAHGFGDVAFPLTPALSLGERVKPIQFLDQSVRLGLAHRWMMQLPLPKGEGWGEGEGNTVRLEIWAPGAPGPSGLAAYSPLQPSSQC